MIIKHGGRVSGFPLVLFLHLFHVGIFGILSPAFYVLDASPMNQSTTTCMSVILLIVGQLAASHTAPW